MIEFKGYNLDDLDEVEDPKDLYDFALDVIIQRDKLVVENAELKKSADKGPASGDGSG